MAPEAASFPELVKCRAPLREFAKWLRAADAVPQKLTEEEWIALVVPAANSVDTLGWLAVDDRGAMVQKILRLVHRGFTELRGSINRQPSAAIKELFGPFREWLNSQSDDLVTHFCWDLLAYGRDHEPDPIWWLHHSKRLQGNISYDNLSLAVALADEADAMFWWPDERWQYVLWSDGSRAFRQLLSHSSYLVRAAAARALGQMYLGIFTHNKDRYAAVGLPALDTILEMIQQQEQTAPGVAGPFLQGTSWSMPDEMGGALPPGIDMRTWFLDTLRTSRQPESETPHLQTLEFYAHEFLSRDAEAIRELLQMGRLKLAVMAATEAPEAIDQLLPVLKEMAASADPGVSAAIRKYLAERLHHAGMDLFLAESEQQS